MRSEWGVSVSFAIAAITNRDFEFIVARSTSHARSVGGMLLLQRVSCCGYHAYVASLTEAQITSGEIVIQQKNNIASTIR